MCDMVYSKKNSIHRHICDRHSDQRYSCMYCDDREYHRKAGLQRHNATKHPEYSVPRIGSSQTSSITTPSTPVGIELGKGKLTPPDAKVVAELPHHRTGS